MDFVLYVKVVLIYGELLKAQGDFCMFLVLVFDCRICILLTRCELVDGLGMDLGIVVYK